MTQTLHFVGEIKADNESQLRAMRRAEEVLAELGNRTKRSNR